MRFSRAPSREVTSPKLNTTGSVEIFDRELQNWDSSFYERIGVSFEFPNHFLKLSAIENLKYFGRLYRQPVADPESLLAQVGLADDGHLAVGQYSKGMKNRLSVARALLHDAELLFLDEPTAGLDPLNARRIRELIRTRSESGKTIFLTTHDMAVADELCHRVAFIDNGRILLIERPSELKLRFGRPLVRVEFEDRQKPLRQEFPLQGLGDDPAFLSLLREKKIRTLHTQEATLEEVFIQITGRKLS